MSSAAGTGVVADAQWVAAQCGGLGVAVDHQGIRRAAPRLAEQFLAGTITTSVRHPPTPVRRVRCVCEEMRMEMWMERTVSFAWDTVCR